MDLPHDAVRLYDGWLRRQGDRALAGREGELAGAACLFPNSIETHCQVQDFFFDDKFELRRRDYSVNIAGGFPAAQLMLEYTEANGMRLPSKRRAYTRGPDRYPILDMLMVSIDISDVAFS